MLLAFSWIQTCWRPPSGCLKTVRMSMSDSFKWVDGRLFFLIVLLIWLDDGMFGEC